MAIKKWFCIKTFNLNQMTLEKQVTNLELSKRLKKLGVKQGSLFYWRMVPGMAEPYLRQKDSKWQRWQYPNQHYSAFTVAELGEMLPETLGKGFDVEQYKYATLDEPYQLEASDYVGTAQRIPHLVYQAKGKTEADARAKMLIYLLENKLI